ncbi:S8 family serine peptidase, partial [Shewanella sp. T24-MNA-CIBAN-0130]
LYSAEVFYRQSEYAQGATLFAIVEALNWLVSNKIPVINMSLTGPNNAILEASITAAIKQNVLIVAAAGNQGPASQPLYPGAYK